MREFDLSQDFVDAELEQRMIATILRNPARHVARLAGLPESLCGVHTELWKRTIEAVRNGAAAPIVETGQEVEDLDLAIGQLLELRQRREVAGAQQRLAGALYDPELKAAEVVRLVAEEAAYLKSCVRESSAQDLRWGSDLLGGVIAMAGERRKQREQTGKPCMGLTTGFARLDQTLNGFGPGLHVLAAGPGAGKTTLALQWAGLTAGLGVPVVYVTYENSPENLVLKLVAGAAGVAASEIERGYSDSGRMEQAGQSLYPALGRLALIEGASRLSVAQIESHVCEAQQAHDSQRVLVVIDYLQRAAHQKGYDQLRHSVSALAGELREMANRTGGVVLAISSQNRSGGDYGRAGSGTPQLDSLKESGDLEYSADTALFLTPDADAKATPPARAMKLVVLKNRFGGTGWTSLIFRPDTGVYREAVGRE